MIMRMPMSVLMRMVMTGRVKRSHAAPQQHEADPEDREPRDNAKHAGNTVRHHVSRDEEGGDAQKEDARGVRECDARAEKGRVFRSAASADKVRGNHGFSVSGFERVQGPKPESKREQGREHGNGNGFSPEDVRNRIGLRLTSRVRWWRSAVERRFPFRSSRRGGDDHRRRGLRNKPRRGAPFHPCGSLVRRRRIFRDGFQLRGRVRTAIRRPRDFRSRAGHNHDLAPARARRIVSIFEFESSAFGRSVDVEFHPDGGKITGGIGHLDLRGLEHRMEGNSVVLKRQPRQPVGSVVLSSLFQSGAIDMPLLHQLEHRHFAQIEHVKNVNASRVRLDAREVVRAQISQRMSGCGKAQDERQHRVTVVNSIAIHEFRPLHRASD